MKLTQEQLNAAFDTLRGPFVKFMTDMEAAHERIQAQETPATVDDYLEGLTARDEFDEAIDAAIFTLARVVDPDIDAKMAMLGDE